MIVPRVHRGVSWRHPYLVPAYAFVVSLLLATAVTVLSAPAEVGAVVPPPVVAPPPPPAPIEEFREAKDGKPTLVVVADPPDSDPGPVDLVVLKPSDEDPNSYIRDPESPGKEITVGTDLPLPKSIVGQLVCVTARVGFTVSPPDGMADLAAATTLDQQRTSCQGGWSDPLAVPAELTFFVRKTG
jgi:hypothetical protein